MFIKYFKESLKLYGKYFWLGAGALAITDILDVLPPLIIMRGVDQIMAKAPLGEILNTALIFGVSTVFLAFVRFYWRMLFGQFHQSVAQNLRERAFNKLAELTPSFYNKNQTGELMSLVSNDVESVRMGMGPGLVVLTDALFYFLTIPPIMIKLSPKLTVYSLALMPLLPFFIQWLGKVIHRRFLVEQEKFSELSGFVQENISGIRTVKSFVQETNQGGKFDSKSSELKAASARVAFAETFFHPVMELAVTLGVVALIYFGTDDVLKNTITVGTFVAFQRYISKMVWPMTAMGWGFSLISQATASLQRLDDLFNTKPEVQHPQEVIPADKNSPYVVELKNLTFTYPGTEEPVLKNINLKIPRGEKLGIVGEVGSGKSTLVQLLVHLYKVDSNMIYIQGRDINSIGLDQLRREITLIPQETFVFGVSVEENIAFGSKSNSSIKVAQVAQAASHACIDKEITSWPQSYKTMIGERGINLSGGQKQRLTIARGLYRTALDKESSLIIFDDSTSAVDAETEKQLLQNISRENTLIIVSHKPSTLQFCDRVVEVKDGQLYS